MKPSRPARRSVSPFGNTIPVPTDPLIELKNKLSEKFPHSGSTRVLKQLSDIVHVPYFLDRATNSTVDKGDLEKVCEFLVRFRQEIADAGLTNDIFALMESIFLSKIDDFLLTHYDQAACEKMGWTDVSRDVVINAKERDVMVGRFFIPFTESSPGLFSEFLTRWIQMEKPDPLMHFLDFCRGSNNPTFEYFLVFSDPAFHRILSNKHLLKGIISRAHSLLTRIPSPTWEASVRSSLSI